MIDDPRINDGSLWHQVAATIEQMQKLVLDDPRVDAPIVRAEGMRYLTRLIAGAIPLSMDSFDHDYPELVKFVTPHIQYGLPAADCCYHQAAVHGDHVYRLYGKRGSAHLFDVESREGHTAYLGKWKLVDRRAEFEVDAQGNIEIFLSAKPQPRNWIRLAEGPGTIIFRQYYYDWLTEEPADLCIERIGATYPPPALTPTEVARRLDLFMAWLRNVPMGCQAAVREYYEAEPGTLKFVPIDFAWADIQYGKGIYRCKPDEAVILEADPPRAPYWSIQLTSHFWEALDWNLRLTSYNGHQARIDPDGKFRAVISHADPGVPNWYDAGGHEVGLVTARYYKAPSVTTPRLRVVKLADLRKELPADTPTVTPEQRQETLRARARSVQRRRM